MPSGLEDARRFLDEIVARAGSAALSPRLTSDTTRAREIVDVIAPIAQAERSAIDFVVVNGRRVDVGVTAPQREWRVVLSIDPEGVHSASAWERPALFPGLPGGRAVVVNGPSSSGKTTVMEAVLTAADTPWVMFDEVSLGRVDPIYLIWLDQAPTLVPGFLSGISALAAAGNQVILAASGFAGSTFDELRQQVRTLDVGLDCPLEVRVDRQLSRADRWGGLTEAGDDLHKGWTYDVRFDTNTTSPEEIANEILRRVAESK